MNASARSASGRVMAASVIKELDAFGKQTLIAFNKIDLLENPDLASIYCRRFPGSVAISAKTGHGIDQFVDALQAALSAWRLRSHFRVPLSESNLIAEIHRVGHVIDLQYDGDQAVITAHVPPHLEQKLTPFIVR